MLPEFEELHLLIPGPTAVPEDIRHVMTRPMTNHRGPFYKALLAEMVEMAKQVFQTQGRLFVLTSSGTGSMEAAIANTISPGDRVLGISIGSFGKRFQIIAERFGAEVTPLDFEWGEAADPQKVAEVLEKEPPFHAVTITHNETSTGVLNPLEEICAVINQLPDEKRPLIIVDGISSLGAANLAMDAWGCDVVTTASQKAWGAPPGLAFIAVSDRGWDAVQKAQSPRFYFDLREYERYFVNKGEPPWTPSVSVAYAMHEALRQVLEEGLENVFARHARVAQYTREGLAQLGMKPFARGHYSPAVTAVRVPEGWSPQELRRRLREEYKIEIAGGQGHLADSVVRIGHLGKVTEADIDPLLEALARILG